MKKIILISFALIFCVNYFNAQSIDNTFGTNGRFQPTDDSVMSVRSVLALADGKILALFTADRYSANEYEEINHIAKYGIIYRLNPNGSIDNQFGQNGKVMLSFSEFEFTETRVLATDQAGNIIIGGLAYNSTPFFRRPLLIKLNSDGSFSNSFGVNGYMIYNELPGYFDSLVITENNQIVAGGNISNPVSLTNWQIAGFQPNGAIDSTFGNNGILLLSPNTDDYLGGLILNQEQNLVYYGNSINTDIFLNSSVSIRAIEYFQAEGNIFQYFSESLSGAFIASSFNPASQIHAMIKNENGLVGIAGRIINERIVSYIFKSEKYFEDGELIEYFIYDNNLFSNLSNYHVLKSIHLLNSGKFFALGVKDINDIRSKLFAVRINEDLSLDQTFNNNEIYEFDLGYDAHFLKSSSILSNGQIIAGIDGIHYNDENNILSFYSFNYEEVQAKEACIVKFIPSCPAESVFLPENITGCDGESITLNPGTEFSSYEWSNGTTSNSINVTVSGIYSVTVNDSQGCTGTASTNVIFNESPDVPVISQVGNLLIATGEGNFIWFLNGIEIPEETTNNLTITQTGDYTVIVTNNLNCSQTSDPLNVTIIGIDESINSSFNIFPNPFHEIFELNFTKAISGKIHVYNSNGKLIYAETIQQESKSIIDSKNWQTGLYLVVIKSQSGASYKKIIKS